MCFNNFYLIQSYISADGSQKIIFVRFGLTFVLSSLYMWYTSVPDFPFGKPELRGLLVLRGCGGFVGVFGFYCKSFFLLPTSMTEFVNSVPTTDSLQYLPIAEAIILTFMTPIFTAYACSIFLRAPFDKKQLLAGLVSFFGVILIAQPGSLFQSSPKSNPSSEAPDEAIVSPHQRLFAVLLGLLGVLGATCAYTTIRVIGPRAHPLLSVNYYGFIATLFSGLILLMPIFPETTFRLPSGMREWGLLLGLGVFGFFLQFLMTAGLVRDNSSKATNMMYSSVLFGLVLDYVIWDAVPGWSSWMGGAVVVTATVWGAMQKSEDGARKGGDEEYAMVPGEELFEIVDDGNEDENGEEHSHEDDGLK